MKKITLLFIILLTSYIGFSQELIQDGGFDTQTGGITAGTSPWSGFNSQIRGAGAAEDPSTGNVNNGEGSIFQLVTVTSGVTYNFSFDYKWISGSGNYVMTMRIKDDLASGKPNLELTGSNVSDGFELSTTVDTWFRDNTFSVTIPDGVTQLRVLFYKGAGNRPVRIDNISLQEDTTASVEDLSKFNFVASPNPVQNDLYFSASEKINKVEIYNLVGQKVMSKSLNTTKSSVNVSSLSRGIYILKTFIGDAVGSQKFIKQ